MSSGIDPLHIVIPSKGRWDRVTTFNIFPSAKIVVSAAEADRYREANPGHEVVIEPDTIRTLAEKRQWIYEHFGNVYMVDDDVVAMNYWVERQNPFGRIEGDHAEALVQRLYEMAIDLDVYLFGFGSCRMPEEYREDIPFALTGFVLASGMGLRAGSKLFFRSDMSLVDDYWIACLNAYYHRKCFIDRRYALLHKDTFHNDGGLATLRSMKNLKRAFLSLQEAFGSDVITRRGRVKNRDPQHEWLPKMQLPFASRSTRLDEGRVVDGD